MRDLLPHLLAFFATWWVHAAVLVSVVVVGLALAGPLAARTRERFYRLALLGSVVSVLAATAWPLLGPRFEAIPPHVSPHALQDPASLEASPAPATTALPAAPMPVFSTPRVPPATPVVGAPSAPAFPWLPLVAGLWLCCAAFALLRAGLSLRTLRARLGTRTAVEDPDYVVALARLSRGAGLRRSPKLTRFAGDGVPVVLGCWRSEISVPVRALTLPGSARDALLAHEVAHVQRRDALWLRVYALFGALLPLSPFVRLATRRLRTLAEQICDEQAVNWTRDPIGMAECLVTAASWMGAPTRTHMAPAMARDARMLQQRVEALLERRPVRTAPVRLTLLVAALLATPLLLPTVVEAGPDKAAKTERPPVRRAPPFAAEPVPAPRPHAERTAMPRVPDIPEIGVLFLEQEIAALRQEVTELLPLLERLPQSPERDHLRASLAARVERIEAEMQAALRAHAESRKEGAK